MTPIPLVDVGAQYRAIKPEIDRAIQAVLDRGQFILGPDVEALERELAAYCQTAHAVAVASGTDALELALRASGIGPGDEVITTAFSFFATAEAVVAVGARPIFVDLEPRTYTLEPTQIEAKLTSKTKALLPVHLYGHPCDMEAIMRLAARHNLKVIEDCAQAIGAEQRGKRVGAFGTAGCLSFYPSKNLGAYGDGGMVVTNEAALADQVRLLRTHGSRDRYEHAILGTNSRLDELQAAILRVKLRHLDAWNEARRRHALTYQQAFQAHRLVDVGLPQEQAGCRHVYHVYAIHLRAREAVRRALSTAGIATQVFYPSTLPMQPALSRYRDRAAYPVAEGATRGLLALPMYPELTSESIERIVAGIARALEATGSRVG